MLLFTDEQCVNTTVRREIDSLNERLTGDGQTVDGGDPNKGALKTKGTIFSKQSASILENFPETLIELIAFFYIL